MKDCLIVCLMALSCTSSLAEFDKNSARALILKSAERSKEFDMTDTLKAVEAVPLEQFNLNELREITKSTAIDSADLESFVSGYAGVASKPENQREMSAMQQISGIPNIEDARGREEILNFLGLSDSRNHMYIFISYSMPSDMIKAYAREAMWSGASLIVRGVKDGQSIEGFIQSTANDLLGNKGYAASLNIDPRLFDAFDIKYVPSIVIADENFIEYCESTGERIVPYNRTPRCKSRPEDKYIKISGAITVDYALEQFVEEGTFSLHASERLTALRANIGKADYTEQVSEYNFKDELLPHQKQQLYEEYSKSGRVVEENGKITVVPFAPPEGVGVHYKRDKKERD